MKILFLTLSRIRDISMRGIYTDLMREFVRRGHEPYIVCPVERRFRLPESEYEQNGVKILHVKTLNIQKTNVIEKGIGTLLLERQYMSAIKRHWNDVKFDLCLYSTPPITFNKVIAWQKKRGIPTYLILKDIFPQNAVDLGMLNKGGILYRMFRKKEEKLYTLSDFIGCMSPANCQYILRNNPSISADKVEICPNSIELINSVASITSRENSVLDEVSKEENLFVRTQYGFSIDKPLFIYGGNLGKPQGIDFLISVLDAIKDRKDVQFCVVGSGTESTKLQAWYETNKPKNVKVMAVLPKDEYDKLVATADIGLIFLDKRFTIPNFPSRLLAYLENKMPVLLATDKNTDMGRIAETNGFGLWSESGELSTILKNIDKLSSNTELRKEMGEKGYNFLLNNYTIDKTADAILKHFN